MVHDGIPRYVELNHRPRSSIRLIRNTPLTLYSDVVDHAIVVEHSRCEYWIVAKMKICFTLKFLLL